MKKVTSWKDLTLREKIGQTVICLCETEKHLEMCGSIESFAKKYPIGGIFNNGGLVKGLLTGSNSEFKKILDQYNKHLRVPLFGAADGGSFASNFDVALPPQMALGAAKKPELAYQAGEFIAEDCRKTGVKWVFWPVCDLNISKVSPVTNVRSVTDKWDLCVRIVSEELKAMKDKKVISSLKHYPGTPVNESIDPHLAPVDNDTPVECWNNTYGKMYRELFAQKPPSIMTGHVNLINYQTYKVDGVYPPATLSHELTTKLLRDELGFEGVTVTDALVMGGFEGNNAVNKCVESFLAGNDVLLWPAYEYIDEMERRILSGEIDEKLLDKAVERIWNLKKEYGIIDEEENESSVDIEFFKQVSDNISKEALTLVNDENKIIPFDKNKVKNVFIVGITPDDKQYQDMFKLKGEFEKYGCKVHMQRNAWTDEVEKASKENDLVLFALCRTTHRPVGPIDFWGDEATSIWASNCSDKNKTVVVSFGSPYFYKYYNISNIPYINAYSSSNQTVSAVVKALLGDIKFNGETPVELI